MKLKTGKLRLNRPDEQKEEDIYTDSGLLQKTDDDQISCSEEGFMRGWLSV